jgi:hypothetical protein
MKLATHDNQENRAQSRFGSAHWQLHWLRVRYRCGTAAVWSTMRRTGPAPYAAAPPPYATAPPPYGVRAGHVWARASNTGPGASPPPKPRPSASGDIIIRLGRALLNQIKAEVTSRGPAHGTPRRHRALPLRYRNAVRCWYEPGSAPGSVPVSCRCRTRSAVRPPL